jgi:hypothetical protein
MLEEGRQLGKLVQLGIGHQVEDQHDKSKIAFHEWQR